MSHSSCQMDTNSKSQVGKTQDEDPRVALASAVRELPRLVQFRVAKQRSAWRSKERLHAGQALLQARARSEWPCLYHDQKLRL